MTSHTPVEETIALLVEVLSQEPGRRPTLRSIGRWQSTLAGAACWSSSRQISRGASIFREVLARMGICTHLLDHDC